VLTLSDEKATLKIEAASGRLLLYEQRSDDGKFPVRLFTRPGAFDRARAEVAAMSQHCQESLAPQRPVSSSFAYLAGDDFLLNFFLECYGLPPMNPEQRETLHAARNLIELGALAPLDALFAEWMDEPTAKFDVPDRAADAAAFMKFNFMRLGSIFALPRSDRYFRRGTWPWTVWRETWFVLAGEPKYAAEELQRLASSEECGPLFYLVTARIVKLRNSAGAKVVARMGLQALTPERFRRDVQVLMDKETVTGRALLHAFEALRTMTDDDARRTGQRLLNRPELLLELVRQLRAHPQVPTDVLAPQLLSAAWDQGLKEAVTDELRKLAE
jgi:hypothetical protein